MALRAPGWQPASPEAFLARNRNVLCSFLLAPFPTIRAESASPLEGAKAVLAGMDTVFDMEQASATQAALLADLGIAQPVPRRENVSTGRGGDFPGEDPALRRAAGDDVALYEWFRDARERQRSADPLYESGLRPGGPRPARGAA